MVCIAFTGNTLATSALNAISQGLKSTNIPSILESIANTVPVQLASLWYVLNLKLASCCIDLNQQIPPQDELDHIKVHNNITNTISSTI